MGIVWGHQLKVDGPAKDKVYPGESAGPEDLFELAEEYRRAAEVALRLCQRGRPVSTAPFRLLTIHAIELYLNALLRSSGHSATCIRGMQHNLALRLEAAEKSGPLLKIKTRQHLTQVSVSKEYITSRYTTEADQKSQLNRLEASLAEVSSKVRKRLEAGNIKVALRA